MEGSLIIKGNYYYAKFRVNGKQKMIATKIPVKGNNKRRAIEKMKEIIESYKDINNGSPQPSYLRKQQEQQQ